MRRQRRHSSSDALNQRRFALNWRLHALESSLICVRRHLSTAIALGSSAAQNLWELRSQAVRCLSIVRAVAGLNAARPMKAKRKDQQLTHRLLFRLALTTAAQSARRGQSDTCIERGRYQVSTPAC